MRWIASMLALSCMHSAHAIETDWQALAKKDLGTAYQTLLDAYPGLIDSNKTAVRQTLDAAYQESRQLLPRVHTERDALAVLDYFSNSLRDPHVKIVGDKLPAGEQWAGWRVEMQGENFVVTASAKDWPITLPPLGSQIESCDGKAVRELLASLAPFYDRRLELDSTWHKLASFITIEYPEYPVLREALPKACELRLPDGKKAVYPLRWQAGPAEFQGSLKAFVQPMTLRRFAPDSYWITQPGFHLDAEGKASMDKLLEKIRQLKKPELVVLDLRGNHGGETEHSYRLLETLFGRVTDANQPAPIYRVSPFAIRNMQELQSYFRKSLGSSSPTYQYLAHMETLLKKAQEEKKLTLELSSDPRLVHKPENPEAVSGPASKAQIVVLTDYWCVSACLIFMDQAYATMPTLIHMGQATSADTPYVEAGSAPLSNGWVISIPMKIRRNPLRASQIAYTPAFAYGGDIQDTVALEKWVLHTLSSRPVQSNATQ